MSDDIKRIKASDLQPDIRNANRGTERGRYALETSLREYGAGRSIVVDKEGRIIAGNKTLQTAAEMGLDDVVVVQTDGRQIVAVQRMDLDLANDDKARMLAYADNRVGELDLDFDPEVLAADLAADLDFDKFWHDDELNAILQNAPDDATWEDAFGALPDEDKAPFQQMTFTLHDTQVEQVKQALQVATSMGNFTDSINENRNGNALTRICETFLTEYGQR